MNKISDQDLLDIIKYPGSIKYQIRTIDGVNWRCKVYYQDNRRHVEILERCE